MGRVMHVQLTPGNRHDAVVARDLLEYARGTAFIADAGYDSNATISAVQEVGMKPVICPNKSRTQDRVPFDRKRYQKRYIVEVFFHRLKNFRAIATRYDKSARNFLALIHLACFVLRTR